MGLGCNNFGGRVDEAGTRAVIDAALDAGVNFLDTADIYGGTRSETFLGRVLEGRRDRVVLATKFGMPIDDDRPGGADPAYLRRAVDESLSRLRTDRIDLYQLHEPDPKTPIADTLKVLDELVREGKVREIGCSNFDADQLRAAEKIAGSGAARFVAVQNELSLLERADLGEGLPEAEALGMAYLPYFPLASGLLTGKYRRGEPPPPGTRLAAWPAERRASVMGEATFDRLEALERWARERDHSLLELAFAWLLARPPVASVIAGATRPEQVQANAAASSWVLTHEEAAAVDAI